jgi:hypothetical protein
MISLTKKSILDSVLAASLCAVCGSVASAAHAAGYQITVYEGTFGPAGNIPYQNGIIQGYATDPDGPLNVPQFADFQYSPANNGINGIAGDYNVSAEASNAHGGTAHAYAFGDGGFSGFSTSVDAQRGNPYPQQGYTGASATVSYGFQLVGPSSATPVPVTFNANAYVKTMGTGVGSALLFVYSDPYNKLVDWELVGGESYQTYPPRRDDRPFAELALCGSRDDNRVRSPAGCGRTVRSDPRQRLRRCVHRSDICAHRPICEPLSFRRAA